MRISSSPIFIILTIFFSHHYTRAASLGTSLTMGSSSTSSMAAAGPLAMVEATPILDLAYIGSTSSEASASLSHLAYAIASAASATSAAADATAAAASATSAAAAATAAAASATSSAAAAATAAAASATSAAVTAAAAAATSAGDKTLDQVTMEQCEKLLKSIMDFSKSMGSICFIGLSLAVNGQHSLANQSICDVGVRASENLVEFGIYAFSGFFLAYSFGALIRHVGPKLKAMEAHKAPEARWLPFLMKTGLLVCFSVFVMAFAFLALVLVNIIESKFGHLSCGYGRGALIARVGISCLSTAMVSGILCVLFVVFGEYFA